MLKQQKEKIPSIFSETFCAESGYLPPWQQKIFSSIMAAMGRQLKQSVNVFHNLTLKRRLPAVEEIKLSTKHVYGFKDIK